MSDTDTEQEIPLEEPETDSAPDAEPDESPNEEPDAEPDEDDAEVAAAIERDHEQTEQTEPVEEHDARDDVDIEKRQKQLIRAADMYVKKVVDALGPDLDGAKPCPLCADFFPGFRFPVMPPTENMPAIRVAIGLEPGDTLPADNYSRACSSCDGWGYTDSGSKVSGQSKLTCYDCAGRGWIAVGVERESGSVTAANGSVASPGPVLQDHPSNDPPEVERLKQLGYVVVAPIEPLPTADYPGIA